MPSQSVRNLYLASSVTELDKKISLDSVTKTTSTKKLVKALEKVRSSAEICYIEKDEEKAYVMYMKFIELFLLLKKRIDFKEVARDFKQLEKFLNPAIDKATELKKSLKKRYEVIKEALDKEREINLLSAEDTRETQDSDVSNVVKDDQLPEKSSDLVSDKSIPKEAIMSEELYSILSNHTSTVIMMDARPQTDFEESHIKHSCCINIPSEILKKGTIGAVLEQKLPPESLAKWQGRSKVDLIVLIDWDATVPVDSQSPLSALIDAMCKWELKNKLKKPPLVLKGGYKDWMLRYPMYTTQVIPISTLENFSSVNSPADLSDVQYPNFDETFLESPKTQINECKSDEIHDLQLTDKIPQANVNGWVSDTSSDIPTNRNLLVPPSVDRRSKPKLETNDIPPLSQSQLLPASKPESLLIGKSVSNSIQNLKPAEADVNSVSIPSVNRNLKPLNVASKFEIEVSAVDSSPKRNTLNVEQSKAIDNTGLAILEQTYAHLCANIQSASDVNKIEIQKQMDVISILLKQAKIGKEEIEQSHQDEEVEKMKLKEVLDKHKFIEDGKGENRPSEHFEIKKKQMDSKFEKFHIEESDKLNERNRAEEKKTISILHQVEHPSSMDVEDKIGQRNQVRRPTGIEYTRLLSKDKDKGTFGHGLTRSHSFPNIAQMVEQEEGAIQFKKPPTVDRSLKPRDHTPFVPVDFSTVRQRNFRPVYGCQARPITGIKNLGNTCYMNSIIQCLSNALPFAQYFTLGDYRQHINRYNHQGTKGEVAEEFAAVIQALWNGQYRSISPYDFLNTVSKYLPICNGHEQQDSHEFLVVLMDKLHGDLKQKCDPKPMPNLELLSDHVAKEIFWDYHKIQNRSKISELFDGLLKSTLRCLSCSKTSHSYEVFSCLSVPISSSKCSLKDCVDSFLKPERMFGEGAWDCPKCKQKKEAEKRMIVCELPNILVVQLKRFSYEGLWRRKLQTNVDFPYKLEMQYEANNYSNLSCSYSLYGVVNHIGTLEGGHYTAYCKNYHTGKWYKYDDHEVTETSSSSIKTSEAYLLFYLSNDCGVLIK